MKYANLDTRTYTDEELEALLPTLPIDAQIEQVIRKFGTTSIHFDGDTPNHIASARAARDVMRKLKRFGVLERLAERAKETA